MNAKIEGLEQDKLNPQKFGGMCSRVAIISKAEPQDDGGYETIATTSAPALVVDWERWQIVREILPMKYCVLPDNDKAPVLDSHMRYSIDDILGNARNWRTSEIELFCRLFISQSEQEVKDKINDGTLDSVSLGYMTDKSQTVEIPKKKEVIIDGIIYKNDFEDDYPLLVRTWWKCREVSIVAIGADDAAKIKRALESGSSINTEDLKKKFDEIINTQKSLENQINTIIEGGRNMPEPTNKTEELTHEQIVERDKPDIEKFGKERFNGRFKGLSEVAIRGGMTMEQFRIMYTDELEKSGGAQEVPYSFLGLNENELERFSFSRMVRTIANNKEGKGKRENCEEFEMSDSIAEKLGQPKKGDRFLPYEIQIRSLLHHPVMQQRTHTTTSLANFIATALRSDLLVEVLKNDLVLGRLGATIITGLRDNITIPKITSTLTAYSIAENAAATKSYLTLGQLTATPKNISAYSEYGRQVFAQSSIGIDTLLMKELTDVLNLKIDYLGLNGSGSSYEPTGLLNADNISAPSLATLDWANILGVKKTLKKANSFKANMKWAGSADVEALLMATPKVEAQPIYLMDEQGRMAGHNSEISNQIPDADLLFGDWPELYLLFWGTREILVNPYSQGSAGMVELNIFDLFDVLVRQSAAFSIADDVPIAA